MEDVRDMQTDLEDIERIVQVLSDVSLVNEAITDESSDAASFRDTTEQNRSMRKEMEFIVRQAIPFYRQTFTSMANYKALILGEVSKILRQTEPNGQKNCVVQCDQCAIDVIDVIDKVCMQVKLYYTKTVELDSKGGGGGVGGYAPYRNESYIANNLEKTSIFF